MITLGPVVLRENMRVAIKAGEAEFGLSLRPVSDDERLFDQGLKDRYWLEDDPEMIGKIHIIRARALLKLVVGWDGVVDPLNNPVPFSREALGNLLAVKDVGSAVAVALMDHFIDGGAGQREKGEPSGSGSLLQGSSGADGLTKSLESSVGTQGDSEQVNLPKG